MDNLSQSADRLKKLGGTEGEYKSGILYGILAAILQFESLQDNLESQPKNIAAAHQAEHQLESLRDSKQEELL